MNEPRAKKVSDSPPWKRLVSRSFIIVALPAFSVYLLFRILLATPMATDYLGRTMSEWCNHKVTIDGLTVTGRTIYLNGIVIEGPPGFPNRKMISARTISLTPDIIGLIQGKRSLSRLEVIGLSVIAEKNSPGSWNFSSLLKRFSKKKEKPTEEIVIKRFSLQDTSIRINDYTIAKLGLSLTDFSTKGTTNSKLALSGKDAKGNPLRLTAEGHLGDNSVFHVTADAPALSLAPLQQFLHGKPPLHFENALGKLTLSADLRDKLLVIQVATSFRQLSYSFSEKSLPIEGHLNVEARYDFKADSAELTGAELTVHNLMTIRARGSMQQASKESAFTLQLTPDKIDLGSFFSRLPVSTQREISLSGEISSRGVELKGDRSKGITTATGDLSLRRVALVQAKQLILTGGAADFSLSKTAQNWRIIGKVFTERQKDTPLIDSLSIPFTALFSPRFKPTQLAAPTIKAMVAGIPLRGSFQYLDTAPVPFTLNCSARNIPFTSLDGFLAKKLPTTRLTSGKVTATAKLSGTSPQDFSGMTALDLVSMAGTSSKRRISLNKTAIFSRMQRNKGIFSASGSLEASGGNLDDKPFSAKTGFTVRSREVTLQKVLCTFASTQIQAREIRGRLPLKEDGQDKKQIPLFASLAGAEVRSGDLTASGIAGQIKAWYFTEDNKRSLVGTSDISVTSLAYRNQPVASCVVRLNADGKNVGAEIKGHSLGGTLSARVHTGIFSKSKETSFTASLLKQELEQFGSLLPGKVSPRISAGIADVLLSGTYTQQSGIDGNIAVTGGDISLKGSSGKTLATGIAATFDSTIHRKNLTVKKGILRLSGGTSLRIGGTVERFASADREGNLSFSIPSATINSLLDTFANALPRNLQEASCEGSCSLAGSAELHGSSTRINGTLSLESASLEIPSQKITVTGIEGSLPFSLEFPWQGGEPEHAPFSYSRENYSRILEGLNKSSGSGNHVSIGTIHFGALETGIISLSISASRGIMKVSPIELNLYDGKLLGSGYLILKGTPEYGVDFLLNDLSLKQFCDSFPSIKGYITGRVDGILSLRNSKSGLKELTGFVNLWTRTGKGEEMLVSKEFLQKLAGKKLRGFFFQNDRPYDNGEISAFLKQNFLTFEKLNISHTNFLGMKDLSVSVAPVQNRIALDHLLESIRDAAARGKGGGKETQPVQTDLKWLE
ncbi:MAG: hypothetical protein PHD01_00455 [Geobacteraceae bacterium]|nr:hypothetical protein [Geobacteraceae bacterium]